jgi:hypothetical protein
VGGLSSVISTPKADNHNIAGRNKTRILSQNIVCRA